MTHKETLTLYFSLVSKLEDCMVGVGANSAYAEHYDSVMKKNYIQNLLEYESKAKDIREELDRLVVSLAAKIL